MPASATGVGVEQEVMQLGLEMQAVIVVTSFRRSTTTSNLNALPCVENHAGIVEGSTHRQLEQGDISWIHCLL